jgi:hypothetical protein
MEANRDMTPPRIVAGLTFGFWVAMFSPVYEDLWRQALHSIVKRPDGKSVSRKSLSRPLAQIRSLRNRVAHHEPIIYWDLSKRYADIVQITEWLSPTAAKWLNSNSCFTSVYPEGGIILAKPEKLIPSILDD